MNIGTHGDDIAFLNGWIVPHPDHLAVAHNAQNRTFGMEFIELLDGFADELLVINFESAHIVGRETHRQRTGAAGQRFGRPTAHVLFSLLGIGHRVAAEHLRQIADQQNNADRRNNIGNGVSGGHVGPDLVRCDAGRRGVGAAGYR